MRIYPGHLKRLEAATQDGRPLLLLPPHHPNYVEALLEEWRANSPGPRDVFIGEPNLGFSEVGTPPSAPSACGEGLDGLLMAAIQCEVGGEWPSSRQLVLWIPSLSAIAQSPSAVPIAVGLLRRLRAVAGRKAWVLMDSPAVLPEALDPYACRVDLRPPVREDGDDAHFGAVLFRSASPRFGKLLDDQAGQELRARLGGALQGLDAGTINVIVESCARWAEVRGVAALDVHRARRQLEDHLDIQRKEHLRAVAGLSIERPETEQLAGMRRLQRYLEYVKVLLSDRQQGIKDGPRPRGVLLVGLPGCGKSLAAKVAARKLGLPLLKLDMGGLMGGLLGESEANLRRALQSAEAAAPCVLWIDEIEKALGGMGGSSEGGGTGARMLGQLLTWMQEHESTVYLFATANAVKDKLPPELLRRGRFDELWRVGLPDDDERGEILDVKLARLGADLDPALATGTAARAELVKLTKDYTGADLASLVDEAWMRARVRSERVSLETVKTVRDGGFAPMAKQFRAEVDIIKKQLEDHGFRDVSAARVEVDRHMPPVPEGRSAPLPAGLLRDLWQRDDEGFVRFERSDGTKWYLWVGARDGDIRKAEFRQGAKPEGGRGMQANAQLERKSPGLGLHVLHPEKQAMALLSILKVGEQLKLRGEADELSWETVGAGLYERVDSSLTRVRLPSPVVRGVESSSHGLNELQKSIMRSSEPGWSGRAIRLTESYILPTIFGPRANSRAVIEPVEILVTAAGARVSIPVGTGWHIVHFRPEASDHSEEFTRLFGRRDSCRWTFRYVPTGSEPFPFFSMTFWRARNGAVSVQFRLDEGLFPANNPCRVDAVEYLE